MYILKEVLLMLFRRCIEGEASVYQGVSSKRIYIIGIEKMLIIIIIISMIEASS